MGKKLLQINAVYHQGSTGTILKLISAEAQKAGFTCYAACPDVVDDEYNICMGSVLERKFHALMTRITGKEGYYSSGATKKLIRWIEENKPDIIHLHNVHSHFLNLNMLASYIAKKNIPTVITMHDCWYFTGKCCHYTVAGCDHWKIGCGNCRKLRKDIPVLFGDPTEKVCHEKTSALLQIPRLVIVGVSDWLANEARNSLLKPAIITRIYNSIDVELFKDTASSWRTKYGLQGKFVILGFANKFLQSRNTQALEAVMSLCDDNTAFVIAGCSEEQRRALPAKIIGIERMTKAEDMARLYSMADVMANVTWEDSLPTVNLEALSCGTPVITYASCGAAETVEPEFCVAPGDTESLKKKIKMVQQTGKNQYSENCRNRAVKLFSNTYKSYIDLYFSLMDS